MTDKKVCLIVDACYEIIHVLRSREKVDTMYADNAMEMHFVGTWIAISNIEVAKQIAHMAIDDELKQLVNFMAGKDNTWE